MGGADGRNLFGDSFTVSSRLPFRPLFFPTWRARRLAGSQSSDRTARAAILSRFGRFPPAPRYVMRG